MEPLAAIGVLCLGLGVLVLNYKAHRDMDILRKRIKIVERFNGIDWERKDHIDDDR